LDRHGGACSGLAANRGDGDNLAQLRPGALASIMAALLSNPGIQPFGGWFSPAAGLFRQKLAANSIIEGYAGG